MKVELNAILISTIVLISNANATIIYKDDTNPTGVPDLTQVNVPGVPANLDSAICFSAAAANGIWYFDHLQVDGKRKYEGLVNHTNKNDSSQNWGPDGYTLVKELTDEIYVKNEGDLGILKYIYSKRGDKDISKETKTYRRGNKVIESTTIVNNWDVDVFTDNKITNDLVKSTIDNKNQVGILMADWHEQGKPATEFMKSGNNPISHHMTVAGRDDQNKQLIVSHGWGDHWKEPNRKTLPVSNHSDYYQAYDYKIEDNHMRITDSDLIDHVGGLAGRTPDYAEVSSVSVIDAQAKQRWGVKYFEKKVVGKTKAIEPALEEVTHFEFFLFNEGPEQLRSMAIEIPVNDILTFTESDVFDVTLPDGWTYRLWDPNIDVAGHHLGTDQGIDNWNGFDFVGLIFESEVDYISPDTGLNIAFDINSDLIAWDKLQRYSVLNTAAWNVSGDTVNLGLAVVDVSEPSTLSLVLLCLLPSLPILGRMKR